MRSPSTDSHLVVIVTASHLRWSRLHTLQANFLRKVRLTLTILIAEYALIHYTSEPWCYAYILRTLQSLWASIMTPTKLRFVTISADLLLSPFIRIIFSLSNVKGFFFFGKTICKLLNSVILGDVTDDTDGWRYHFRGQQSRVKMPQFGDKSPLVQVMA